MTDSVLAQAFIYLIAATLVVPVAEQPGNHASSLATLLPREVA